MIPFREEFREAVVSGQKTCTARNQKYGTGLQLTTFGYVDVTLIERTTLADVRDNLWRREGCESPQHFAQVWRSIHPRAGFRSDKRVWVHHFRYVGEPVPA